jgi:hypothetical protein
MISDHRIRVMRLAYLAYDDQIGVVCCDRALSGDDLARETIALHVRLLDGET